MNIFKAIGKIYKINNKKIENINNNIYIPIF